MRSAGQKPEQKSAWVDVLFGQRPGVYLSFDWNHIDQSLHKAFSLVFLVDIQYVEVILTHYTI